MPTYSCEGDGTSQKGSSRTRRRVTLTVESSADVVLVTNEDWTTRYRLPTPRSSHKGGFKEMMRAGCHQHPQLNGSRSVAAE